MFRVAGLTCTPVMPQVLRGRLMVLEFFRDVVAPYAAPRDQAQHSQLRCAARAACAARRQTDARTPYLSCTTAQVPPCYALSVEVGEIWIVVTSSGRCTLSAYACPTLRAATYLPCRQWLLRVSPLLEDRALELRHLAQDVVEALWAAPGCREALNQVAYNSNHQDVIPLRKLVLALNGSAPGAGGGDLAVAGMAAGLGVLDGGSTSLRSSVASLGGTRGPSGSGLAPQSSYGAVPQDSLRSSMAVARTPVAASASAMPVGLGNLHGAGQGDVVMGDAYAEPSPARLATLGRVPGASPSVSRQAYDPAAYFSPARPGMATYHGAPMDTASEPGGGGGGGGYPMPAWAADAGAAAGAQHGSSGGGSALPAGDALGPQQMQHALYTAHGAAQPHDSDHYPASSSSSVVSSLGGVDLWVSSGGADAPVSRAPILVPQDKNAQVGAWQGLHGVGGHACSAYCVRCRIC